MRHRKLIVLVILAVVVLLLAAVTGVTETFPHKLRFQPGDGSIKPLFVLTTHGEPHTNYTTTGAGLKVAQAGFVHRFYYASQNSIEPGSAWRYWTGYYLARVLGRLVRPDRFVLPRSDDFAGTVSVLWLGYCSSNSIFSEDAVLESEQGLQLALSPRVEDSRTHSVHLMSWEIPGPLTKHGKYRLVLPKGKRVLLTFVYN